ncbi:ZIP family metal transporter [Leptolyngbya sp. FACHB-16]|uniref:ZIP family metal transporter n=1 Tax=unclassified Leptolyngbya TaxID=2650499 RepID=UPI0016882599|nr:ZIP family metal transporter [Leptolyngbya sp. FACHB-16]MBD2153685.1 ZIP family metal transporter [Leptolyngbya sp. FACHB-16]
MNDLPVLLLGLAGSTIAGLCTGVGALPIFLFNRITQNTQGVLLGFGAGVMLAATSFSLIVPGLEAAMEKLDPFWAAMEMVISILLGGAFLWVAHRYFPHEHFFKGRENADQSKLKRIWLFILAIAIHNFPEGLAVGVGFGGENISNGIALTTGIGLQNIPEGLVVAISLLTENYTKLAALWISLLTGLVEPIGGFLGAAAVSLFQPFLPLAMGFAAGAMLFVISDEIIPESHRLGYEKAATIGVMVGFVLMFFLDVTLG